MEREWSAIVVLLLFLCIFTSPMSITQQVFSEDVQLLWMFAGFNLKRTNYSPGEGTISMPQLIWRSGDPIAFIDSPPVVADIDSDGTTHRH
jgi:hypothetical protein